MLSIGLVRIGNRRKELAAVLVGGGLILTGVFASQASVPGFMPTSISYEEPAQPVHEAAFWLENNSEEDDLLYTNDRYPLLGHYSEMDIRLLRRDKPVSELEPEFTKPGYLYVGSEDRFGYPDRGNISSYSYTRLVWEKDDIRIYRIDPEN